VPRRRVRLWAGTSGVNSHGGMLGLEAEPHSAAVMTCVRDAKGSAEVVVEWVEWGRGRRASVRIDDMALSRVAMVPLGPTMIIIAVFGEQVGFAGEVRRLPWRNDCQTARDQH
jgi:hypothetical protein